jgi:hypothetical protein
MFNVSPDPEHAVRVFYIHCHILDVSHFYIQRVNGNLFKIRVLFCGNAQDIRCVSQQRQFYLLLFSCQNFSRTLERSIGTVIEPGINGGLYLCARIVNAVILNLPQFSQSIHGRKCAV